MDLLMRVFFLWRRRMKPINYIREIHLFDSKYLMAKGIDTTRSKIIFLNELPKYRVSKVFGNIPTKVAVLKLKDKEKHLFVPHIEPTDMLLLNVAPECYRLIPNTTNRDRIKAILIKTKRKCRFSNLQGNEP